MSLTLDTWTTTNHLTILGIVIHLIDDMWNLQKCVFVVKELSGSHGGAHMTKVLHDVLVDYNLIDKVIFLFLHNFLY